MSNIELQELLDNRKEEIIKEIASDINYLVVWGLHGADNPYAGSDAPLDGIISILRNKLERFDIRNKDSKFV
jgi:hypothetical protein